MLGERSADHERGLDSKREVMSWWSKQCIMLMILLMCKLAFGEAKRIAKDRQINGAGHRTTWWQWTLSAALEVVHPSDATPINLAQHGAPFRRA